MYNMLFNDSLTPTAFGKREFWETRYGQLKPGTKQEAYDWYVDWKSGLDEIFKEYVVPYSRFVAGKGKSQISASSNRFRLRPYRTTSGVRKQHFLRGYV